MDDKQIRVVVVLATGSNMANYLRVFSRFNMIVATQTFMDFLFGIIFETN